MSPRSPIPEQRLDIGPIASPPQKVHEIIILMETLLFKVDPLWQEFKESDPVAPPHPTFRAYKRTIEMENIVFVELTG